MHKHFTAPPRRDPRGPAPSSAAERFWPKVDKSGECWIWTGGTAAYKYGTIWAWDHERGRCRMLRATRVSWEMHYGPIPHGMEVCHNCPSGDNPRCVRPEHLFLGTHAANMADAAKKKRTASGERNASAKLTAAQVKEIRARFAAGGITNQELARRFGMSEAAMHNVLKGNHWRHVT